MNILQKVNDYYTDKVKSYGTTPKGVDWNSAESQNLRFTQLLKVVPDDAFFSILDYGCGFGSLYEFMNKSGLKFSYIGYDVSEEMIANAEKLFGNSSNCNWVTKLKAEEKFDYVLASGIFNVRLDVNDLTWEEYIIEILNSMAKKSIKGFSFNCLTSYSDKEYMKDYLYYADPLKLFDYCKKNFSRNVALLHDYNLYEFTLIVKHL